MKIKFGIVGLGHIGKRHATLVSQNDHCELVGFVDTNIDAVKGLDHFSNIPLFESIDALFNAGIRPDVVVIATPNGLHAELAINALNHKAHVIIEKPMALTVKECEEVIMTGLRVSRHIFIVKQNRYSPPSLWLKEIVDKKIIGDIYMVQTNCYWNRDERYYSVSNWKGTKKLDGGTLFTQFSHFVDIMYWVFGDIKNIKSVSSNFNHANTTEFEDSGFVNFQFENGGIGSINYSTSVWDSNLESSITVIGSKGSIKIGGQYMNKIEHCNIKDYTMPELKETNPPNDYGPYKGSAANHHYVIENVVKTIKGEDTISTNALEGMKTVDIIERIYKATDNV